MLYCQYKYIVFIIIKRIVEIALKLSRYHLYTIKKPYINIETNP